ncbi:mitochondrial ribosomal protein MRP51 [Nemania sp. FL0916]|nr:mitochondrial ribosomal protein MRP51 [Nemania sp. FL0916]
MAARSVSPGAALLRSSRMFSIPNPISAIPGESAAFFRSDTATTSFPTHLTITTTSTSRANGDWGFKRPLPLKTTTKQTYPLVRVRQMDSIEHVTDFQSASDHTMTLKKVQELNLPLFVPPRRLIDKTSLHINPTSVFEEDGDITDISDHDGSNKNTRWKFKGPWLPGMTDGDFNKWLEKSVRRRRAEFHVYLKEACAKELTKTLAAQAGRDRLPAPPEVKASEITEPQFIDYLRDLRQDRLELYRQVGTFLDLAPLSDEPRYLAHMRPNRSQEFDRPSPYATGGPPITHPSAGLSYLRTHNFMENHPVYGPQKHHPAVKTRILKPRSVAAGTFEPAIGVAGFIADRPVEQRTLGRSMAATHKGYALTNLEIEEQGGAKMYLYVDAATVDSQGRVLINISDVTNPMVELVAKEMLGEDDADAYSGAIEGAPANKATPERSRNSGSFSSFRRPQIYGSRESYGLGQNRERNRGPYTS